MQVETTDCSLSHYVISTDVNYRDYEIEWAHSKWQIKCYVYFFIKIMMCCVNLSRHSCKVPDVPMRGCLNKTAVAGKLLERHDASHPLLGYLNATNTPIKKGGELWWKWLLKEPTLAIPNQSQPWIEDESEPHSQRNIPVPIRRLNIYWHCVLYWLHTPEGKQASSIWSQ